MLRLPCFPINLVVPSTFEKCLTYGQQQLYMWKYIQQLEERVAALEQQVNVDEQDNT